MNKFFILFSLALFPFSIWASEPVFKFHLSNEPSSLDPNKQRSSSSAYLLGNLYRNLLKYDDAKGLQNDLGAGCSRDKKNNLICKIKSNLLWSDGTPLNANDFLETYKKILDPKNSIPRADLLFGIKNAKAIYLGKKRPQDLGVTAPDNLTLRFEFEESQPEFEYNLANSTLAPTKRDLSAFNGPYQIKDWKKGQKLILTSNPNYTWGAPKRPNIEVLFIEEDSVALQLYEKDQLDFLRRLPTLFIPKYKAKKDFLSQSVIRFDYIGFGPSLKERLDIRKSLSLSLDYEQLQKIFSSRGRPGCVGLPSEWFPGKSPCIDFDPSLVKKISDAGKLDFYFSALGGEDHKVATEWMQNQWLKSLGVKVSLEVKENKIFLQTLQRQPPAIFRKGVAPDRPTCLAALESFFSDSPENYIRLKDADYDTIVLNLRKTKKAQDQKELCLSGVNYLLKKHLIIPLGAIEFSMLMKTRFRGWKLNKLNELDLSNLTYLP